MRWPDLHGRRAVVVAAAGAVLVVVAGSILAGSRHDRPTDSATEATAASSTWLSPTAVTPANSSTVASPGPASTSVATPAPTTSASAAPPPVSAPVVRVGGGVLPVEITGAIRERNGELVDPDVWYRLVEPPAEIPRLAGAGVQLAAASVQITTAPSGWVRTDALQWLFTDRSDAFDAVVDRVVDAAGLTGAVAVGEERVVEGAWCVERSFTASGGVWRTDCSGGS